MARWSVLLLVWLMSVACSPTGSDGTDLGMTAQDMSTGPEDMSTGFVDMSTSGPTKECSSDGWCWENPLPKGNDLAGVWGTDANNVWAVGAGGTILKWNGTAWAPESSGTTNSLDGVWGADANNVWAVGHYGAILHKSP